MGVKDLWKLLEPAGRPVKLESLEGLVVGVDVSIWLNQAVKGVRDRHGEPVPYAHLIVLFNRICKLLHYHIKPVFVFDGATPLLKQQTLTSRSKRRDLASQRSLRAADKRASKLLQAKILEHLTGETSSLINVTTATTSGPSDMFQLPPIPEDALSKEKSPTFEEPLSAVQSANTAYYSDVASVDVHSKEFDGLPPEVQHEILLERQQIEKYSYHDPDTLPQVANDFSNYQLSRLMKRSRISQKLEGVRKVLKSNDTAIVGLGEESNVHEVETSRIASSEAAHYILVKGTDMESQSSQDEQEDDLQSQTSSLSVQPEVDIRTASREEIEYEVQKFFKERVGSLEVEDGGGASKSTLATANKRATVGKVDAIVLESEPSGEEDKIEDLHKRIRNQDVAAVENDTAAIDDVTSQVVVQEKKELPGSALSCSLPKQTLVDEGDNKISSLSTATSTGSKVNLFAQTTTSLTSSTPEVINVKDTKNDLSPKEKVAERSPPLHIDTLAKEENEASSSSAVAIELTAIHTQDQPKSPAASPLTEAATESMERDFLCPVHGSVAAATEVTLIESDDGGSPPPLATAVVVSSPDSILLQRLETGNKTAVPEEVAIIESDEGGSPSPPLGGWSGGKEVEALLAVAPSEAQEQLNFELEELEKERTRQSRAAAAVSNQMYKEAQELLSLFGLPYMVAPTEAEAQCATLNDMELTQATITDDNDIFLFGGKKVYRHFFSQDREVEVYNSSELQQRLGLSRDHLIVLAYLLGSDYTEGLEGIGIVMAMEVLRDFPGTGLEPLIKLSDWHGKVAHKPAIISKGSALQKKLCQFPLPAGFPSAAVRDSYLNPEIDDSSEHFEWGKPDLDLIRRFSFDKMGWSQEKVDEILLPVLKRMNARESQTQKKITQFMSSLPSPSKQKRTIKSKRIRNVVARLTAEDDAEEQVPRTKSAPSKRRRSRGASQGTKKKQPASKRQKKSNAAQGSSVSEGIQPVLPETRSNLSASSSSSSEDEFDSLVKNWSGCMEEENSAVENSIRTKGK